MGEKKSKWLLKIGVLSLILLFFGVASNCTYADNEMVDEEYIVEDIFPDKEFRQLVVGNLHELSIPVNENGKVKQSELDQIKEILFYSEKPIESIEGIQYLKNIIAISLTHTKISDLKPLENLLQLWYISIRDSEISDITPLKKIFENSEAKGISIKLKGNLITDFSLIPELNELGMKRKPGRFFIDMENQRINFDSLEKITKLPREISFPQVILHDGSKLNYEEIHGGHFSNGNFILEELDDNTTIVEGVVKKQVTKDVKYGISPNIKISFNYLTQSDIKTKFTINVNEYYNFDSPFKELYSESNMKYLDFHDYYVNKEEIDVTRPGTYKLNYLLYKFKNNINYKLDPIPIEVNVKVLPVIYNVRFIDDQNNTLKTSETNADMTVTQPSRNPVKDGYVFKGWMANPQREELFDFTQLVTGYMDLYAKWEKIPEQGDYIPFGKYVTITKPGYKSWASFDWDHKNHSHNLFGNTYQAKGKYEHRNGSTYYSIYNHKGKWEGYINAEATTVSSEKQGVFIPENKYVTVSNNSYSIWSNFNWKLKKNSKEVIYKTYLVKGKYTHFNGSTFYSLYDQNNKWHGYLNKNGTRNSSENGAYINYGKKVKVKRKGYNTWQNFDWKYKYSNKQLLGNEYEARGFYYHVNGNKYYSLFNKNNEWQGYINEAATR